MLGRFSSAEVCCLNSAEREETRGGADNKEVRRGLWRWGKSEEERGVFSGLDCS